MNLAYLIIYVCIGLLGLAGTFGLGRMYARGGTVRAALQTVELLRAQVDTLTTQNTAQAAQIATLTNTVDVLREQVTQAAPVRELARVQAERHNENVTYLTRLEGSLSRIESKIMRGE